MSALTIRQLRLPQIDNLWLFIETLVDATITLSNKKSGSIDYNNENGEKPWEQLWVTLSISCMASISVLIVFWVCKIVNWDTFLALPWPYLKFW